MTSTIHSTHYADSPDLALAALRHPTLEQALSSACAQLAVREAYLAALRDPAIGRNRDCCWRFPARMCVASAVWPHWWLSCCPMKWSWI